MELLLVLFLAAFENDPAFKARLSSMLEFYRDNRELLHALAGSPDGPKAPAAGNGAQKSSPPAREESRDLLETLLKGL